MSIKVKHKYRFQPPKSFHSMVRDNVASPFPLDAIWGVLSHRKYVFFASGFSSNRTPLDYNTKKVFLYSNSMANLRRCWNLFLEIRTFGRRMLNCAPPIHGKHVFVFTISFETNYQTNPINKSKDAHAAHTAHTRTDVHVIRDSFNWNLFAKNGWQQRILLRLTNKRLSHIRFCITRIPRDINWHNQSLNILSSLSLSISLLSVASYVWKVCVSLWKLIFSFRWPWVCQ